MTDDLLELVMARLLPSVPSMGFAVREHEAASSFDNAYVVLESRELRIRILRERSQLFLEVGSMAEPSTWFDSAVLIDDLDLSDDSGFHGRDTEKFVSGVARFLVAFETELRAKFERTRFAETKAELSALRDSRAGKRLGFA